MTTRPNQTKRVFGVEGWLASVLLLVLAGCGLDRPTAVAKPAPVCGQPLSATVLSNDIRNTFYPGSKWEQAKDLLDPAGSYHKYGMNFNTSVRIQNRNDGDLVVKRSVGNLIIKNDGMPQRSYEAVAPEFVVRAKSDTVIHFEFKVDIASLSADYFKLIVSSEKVGYFFKSSHKYSYRDSLVCSDTSLVTRGANAADSTIEDYVSIPEITDATYNGAVTASEVSAASAKWSVDNWGEIKCALFVLVLLVGIVLGGHAGSSSGC